MDLKPWKQFVETLDCRPLFVTISGAHIYGFPSPDSDVDLRGSHLLPLDSVVGLSLPSETIDQSRIVDDIEVDLVSHDIGKYLRLLVKNNGYVLEQIFSPLVVLGETFLDELKPIANRCITRFHCHHYLGFYSSQRKQLEQEPIKKAKSLLYAYRVLLTGIHLMQSGRIETDIRILSQTYKLDFISDLIGQKQTEKIELVSLDWDYHAQQLDHWAAKLEASFWESRLPEQRDQAAVNELLVRTRLADRTQ